MLDWILPDVRLPLCEMGKGTFQQLHRNTGSTGPHQSVVNTKTQATALAVVLCGADGRMGQAIQNLCASRAGPLPNSGGDPTWRRPNGQDQCRRCGRGFQRLGHHPGSVEGLLCAG